MTVGVRVCAWATAAVTDNPNAAKLWEEFLYSDEGQTQWLAGYCHPILFNDMTTRGVVPADLVAAPFEQGRRSPLSTTRDFRMAQRCTHGCS